MKYLFTAFVLFVTSTLLANDPIEKNIGDFSTLKVYDLIAVNLVKSNENKVVITGKNTKDVLVNNKNGKLKIKMRLEKIFDGSNTSITLYYTNIDIIDANEGATISSEDRIKQFEIDLRAQEGAKIDVDIKVTIANIKAVTGGIVTATGKARKQNISLLTGGIYEAEYLKTENTTVAIKAAGEAHINASESVNIKIRAGGDVYIYGNPKKVKENKVFGGRIKRIDS